MVPRILPENIELITLLEFKCFLKVVDLVFRLPKRRFGVQIPEGGKEYFS
jgi:hypothetical protein